MSEDLELVLMEAEERMQKAIAHLQQEFATIRTGRAHPGLVERLKVEAYGDTLFLNQLANISILGSDTILIQPWDRSILRNIEQAIFKSDLGLTPSNDGTVIRLKLPPLTEERRRELARLVGRKAEESRVAIRNIRRDAREALHALEEEEHISEDEVRRAEKELDKLTEKYIAEVDRMKESKEEEVMSPH